MKKHFLIAGILLLAVQYTFAQAPLKIGYVDSQIILTQLPEAIKAQGDLDALQNKWSAELDSMTLKYQQALEDYQKQAATMTEDKKLAAQQQLVGQEQNILNFRRQKFGQGGDLMKRQEEIFNPIKTRIFDAIERVAKEEAMQFVFDKSGDIVLLYADAAFDITYKVMDKLKRGN